MSLVLALPRFCSTRSHTVFTSASNSGGTRVRGFVSGVRHWIAMPSADASTTNLDDLCAVRENAHSIRRPYEHFSKHHSSHVLQPCADGSSPLCALSASLGRVLTHVRVATAKCTGQVVSIRLLHRLEVPMTVELFHKPAPQFSLLGVSVATGMSVYVDGMSLNPRTIADSRTLYCCTICLFYSTLER